MRHKTNTRLSNFSGAGHPTSDCHNPWYEERGQVSPSVLFLPPQLPCLLAPVHSAGSIVQPGSLPAYIRGPISGESSRRGIADCTVRTNRAIAHPYSCRHGAFEQPIVALDQGRDRPKT